MQLARQADGLGAERRSRSGGPPVVAAWPSVKTRYSTWATAATRAGISVTGGTAKGSATSSSRTLARTMRCAMVDSGTRNERAICAVVRPATARKVSATCDGLLSDGWQHNSITASVSSRSTDASSGPTVPIARPRVGHALLAPGAGAVGAQPVDEPARRHPNQPGLRVVGRSLGGPLASGGDERLLQGVLREVESAVAAHERTEHVWRARPPDDVEARVAHASGPPAHIAGRSSITSPGWANAAAISSARSRDSTSTRKNPARCSLRLRVGSLGGDVRVALPAVDRRRRRIGERLADDQLARRRHALHQLVERAVHRSALDVVELAALVGEVSGGVTPRVRVGVDEDHVLHGQLLYGGHRRCVG